MVERQLHPSVTAQLNTMAESLALLFDGPDAEREKYDHVRNHAVSLCVDKWHIHGLDKMAFIAAAVTYLDSHVSIIVSRECAQ